MCGCRKERSRQSKQQTQVAASEQLAHDTLAGNADAVREARIAAEQQAADDARTKELARRAYIAGKIQELVGREFNWQTGEPNNAWSRTTNWLWSILDDNVQKPILNPGPARLDGYRDSSVNLTAAVARATNFFMKCGVYDGAASTGPLQQAVERKRKATITRGEGVTHYKLNLGQIQDELVVDLRPETSILRDMKLDWNLMRCAIQHRNDFGVWLDEIMINTELLVNLLSAQVWDRSMTHRQIHDRMAQMSKSLHTININRYEQRESIQQNTVRVAVGITISQMADKHYLDFTLGLAAQALPSASVTEVEKLRCLR